MFDSFVEVSFLFGSLLDMIGMFGGLFAFAALCWLLATKQGRSFLDWFGDQFL